MPATVFSTYDEAKAAARSPEIVMIIEQPTHHLIATVTPNAELIAMMGRRPNGALQATRLTVAENVPSGPVQITLDPANDDGAASEPMVRQFLEIISEQAARAIGGADRAGAIQLSRLYPGDKGMMPRRFNIGDVDDMVHRALIDAKAGHNVYIEGRTVRNDANSRNRGKIDDTAWVFAFVIDSDADKGCAGNVLPVEPSLTVESSPGNFHYWFFLENALPPAEAQEIGKAIRKASGADKDTGVITQPYRVAGALNFPDKTKLARGRYVALVRLVECNGTVYSADELRDAFKAAPADDNDDASGDASDFESRAWVKEDALPAELRKLIINGVDGTDEDRSAKFFGVVASLKKRFWPLDTIIVLFEKYPDGIAAKYAGRIREETKRAWQKIEPARDNLPVISLRAGELTQIVADVEAALARASVPVFERAGVLVHPHKETFDAGDGRKALVATLNRYTQESMHIEIDKSATFVKWKKNNRTGDVEPVPDDPPPHVTRLVLGNTRHWKAQRVAGIITTPLLHLDGSLLGGSKPHYDAASCVYYMPGVTVPPIADNPTWDAAKSNLDFLIDLLDEFPFLSQTDRSVALSGILTALVRPAIDTAPMHMFRARIAGSGKSYLVEIASTIATGSLCAVMAVPESEEELEKRLGSLIMKGVSIISLDNADIDVGGAALCQLTERPRVSLRILGRSEMPEYDCRATVFCTGNNVGVRGDMTRRVLMCNLDRGVERPELYEFRANPIAMVRANRGDYIAAALTIVRAYIAAGEPAVYKPLGSYAQWCRMVRGPLIWLEQADPVASMEDARRDDPELAAIRTLLTSGWLDVDRYYRAKDIIEASNANAELKDLLASVAGERGDVSNIRLGAWLRRISGRVVDGRRLINKTGGRTAQYYIEMV